MYYVHTCNPIYMWLEIQSAILFAILIMYNGGSDEGEPMGHAPSPERGLKCVIHQWCSFCFHNASQSVFILICSVVRGKCVLTSLTLHGLFSMSPLSLLDSLGQSQTLCSSVSRALPLSRAHLLLSVIPMWNNSPFVTWIRAIIWYCIVLYQDDMIASKIFWLTSLQQISPCRSLHVPSHLCLCSVSSSLRTTEYRYLDPFWCDKMNSTAGMNYCCL